MAQGVSRRLSLPRPEFETSPVNVRFVEETLAMVTGFPPSTPVFLRVLQFSPITIIPTILHTNFHVDVALTRRTNGRSLGGFQKAINFLSVVAKH